MSKSDKAFAIAVAALVKIEKESSRANRPENSIAKIALADIAACGLSKDNSTGVANIEYRLKDVSGTGSWAPLTVSVTDSKETITELIKEMAESELGWSEHYRGFEWREKPTRKNPNPSIYSD